MTFGLLPERADGLPPTSQILPYGKSRVRLVNIHDLGPRLTPTELEHPAYFVNGNFETEWWNDPAKALLLPKGQELTDEISGRSVLYTLLTCGALREAAGFDDILKFHLSIAKQRLGKAAVLKANTQLNAVLLHQLGDAFDETEAAEKGPLLSADVNLAPAGAEERWYTLYAASFREGILFSYAPALGTAQAVAALLSRRDVVIRDILKNRKPYFTKLAVLVADLESSVRICAELPPDEYFELINDVWHSMARILRKYYATHGKHVGDGLVYYFLPQPDSHYLFNAIQCAQEMREKMQEISQVWKARKNWLNDLRLNMGIDEGQEWFGTYQTPSHLEFTVLGDTINRTARLSDFAQGGSIWMTKAMLSKLSPPERERLQFGIQYDRGGHLQVVLNSYARMANLIDLNDPGNKKLCDIAGLTVAELFGIQAGAKA
ncbi:MAG: adenylate/guanylate cyclase domain-containing protein [Micropepsaceae bacterium]